MKKLFTIVFFSIFLTSCASYRPSSEEDYERAEKQVLTKNENVKFHGKGGWHPKTTKLIIGRGTPNEGNLVITDKTVYFMQWDDDANSYDVLYRSDISDIKNVKLYKTLNNWIIIQSGDTKFDMFAFPFDMDKTEQAFIYIKQAIQKNASK